MVRGLENNLYRKVWRFHYPFLMKPTFLCCCDRCDSTCLPLVLPIARPKPSRCHSTTDCSVTAYCTAYINTRGSSMSCSFPSLRCTDLATGLRYGRLSQHPHIPNVSFTHHLWCAWAASAFKVECQN